MSTPTSPGWYDDPDDANQLRYFDGVVWSRHTTPRSTRPVAANPQAGQQEFPGQGHPPQYPGQGEAGPPAAQPPAQQYGQPPQQQYGQPPQQQYGQPPQQQYGQPPQQQYGQPAPWNQPPASPQFPGAPQQGQWHQPAYASAGPATPDGQPLAGYAQRFGAFVLDWILQLVLGVLAGAYFLARAMGDYLTEIDRAMQDMEEGGTPDLFALSESVDQSWLAAYSITAIIVFLAYQVFFLTRYGATPGKMATNISVRLKARPGRPPLQAVLRRVGLPAVLFALQLLPLLGFFGIIARLLDLVWPSWDKDRQALHDKVAGTVVVTGRQPR
jgi:uncharacterized RDD family membrane protein YckC